MQALVHSSLKAPTMAVSPWVGLAFCFLLPLPLSFDVFKYKNLASSRTSVDE